MTDLCKPQQAPSSPDGNKAKHPKSHQIRDMLEHFKNEINELNKCLTHPSEMRYRKKLDTIKVQDIVEYILKLDGDDLGKYL